MSRTLPRPRSLSPGKSVCEIMALICGEDTGCFSSLEAGILAQELRMSTPKKFGIRSVPVIRRIRRETLRRGVDSGVIEETARLDESYTPIPLKHLASCQIGASRSTINKR